MFLIVRLNLGFGGKYMGEITDDDYEVYKAVNDGLSVYDLECMTKITTAACRIDLISGEKE